MTTIQGRIESDYIAAYKAKDTVRLAVLRHLKTAAKNREVEILRPLTDDDFLEIIARQIKQRRESLEQYEKHGRTDLAAVESAELAVLQDYMPTALTEAELAQAIDRLVAETGAQGPKDMGKVMQALTLAYKGRYDGKKASEAVRARLSS
ncbi:MAG TPA: GatB/YqeY domain-containing protein [Humidesulfovibrio sp.]|uniref:GatB/YqeY domain-containing protein n=1 Tax=Humidesulfovibrio sp. TaxID=2910988 RepID=UPI002C1F3A81|nr:GatB/YqeY domain-containing protein [Humidesulfovibrio sp.]HWR02718.1 GatB/YqeY domain-containing protein [Humidesulfovibrio sp.]